MGTIPFERKLNLKLIQFKTFSDKSKKKQLKIKLHSEIAATLSRPNNFGNIIIDFFTNL
jgi:hypothetical protein